MMNKQLAFVKSGLGLALCFLMVGAGVTPPIHASNANVSISQQAKKVTGTVTAVLTAQRQDVCKRATR